MRSVAASTMVGFLALACSSASRADAPPESADSGVEVVDDAGAVTVGDDAGASATTPTTPEPAPAPASCNSMYGGVRELRRITDTEFTHIVEDLFGIGAQSAAFPASYGKSVTGFSTEQSINTIGEEGLEQLIAATEAVALALSPKVPELLECASNADIACASTFLDTYGSRAFRRPLLDEERQPLLDRFEVELSDGASFSDAIAVMSAQMLQMPAFVYVVEQAADPGQTVMLDGFELAARLSFFFWSSVPDEELMQRAASGDLESSPLLAREVKRLLDDPKAERMIVRFFREWIHVPRLTLGDKDIVTFPFYNEGFADSVNEAFDRFVIDQIRAGATLSTLLTTNTAIANQDTAQLWKLDGINRWSRVELDGTRYSGLLTQPAVMAALAHTNEPSYVFRGSFIRQRLLCQELGTPPGNALAQFADLEKPENPTGKETAEIVQSASACGGCHRSLDPLGLAFENFDALGQYRDSYPSGRDIDPSGELTNVDDETFSFKNHVELLERLSESRTVRQCFSKQLVRFAVSRKEGREDTCAIDEVELELASSGRIDSAFVALALTPTFRTRKGVDIKEGQ